MEELLGEFGQKRIRDAELVPKDAPDERPEPRIGIPMRTGDRGRVASGIRIERESSTVSSSEIVVATPIATSTATASEGSPEELLPVIAATTRPVITLIIGSVASSRNRSETGRTGVRNRGATA